MCGSPLRALVAAAAAAFLPLASSDATTGFFTTLGDFPGGMHNSGAFAISADGSTVVGTGSTAAGFEAFRWTAADGLVALGVELSVRGTSGHAVSADGTTVVGAIFDEYPNTSGFLWASGNGMVRLSGCQCTAFDSAEGTSADGAVVVGRMITDQGFRGYRWTAAAGAVSLGDFPGGNPTSDASDVSADGSVVVGNSGDTSGPTAYRWTAAEGMVSLGKFTSRGGSDAAAVSPDGSVVVGYSSHNLGQEGALWRVGENIRGLGFLPEGNISYPADVSIAGQVVVGSAEGPGGRFAAFRWTERAGMRSVQALLHSQGIDTGPWWLQTADAISDDGSVIAGSAYNAAGDLEAYVAVIPATYVPEPNAACVVLAAAIGFIFARRPARCGSA